MSTKEAPTDILTLALAFYQAPIRHQDLLKAKVELPDGVKRLLQAANGALQAEEQIDGAVGVRSEKLREAAIFFIEQVFFTQDASYYRVLGLNPDATPDQLKEHHQLLMRLFHPDRSGAREAWTDVYACRINQAYTVLRSPKLRRAYAASLQTLQQKTQATPPVSRSRSASWTAYVTPGQSTSVVRLPRVLLRYFPQIVLAGITLLAILLVIMVYLFQRQVVVISW